MGLSQMLLQAADGAVEIEPGWSQGRACFGGLVGALMLAAIKARLPVPAPLRSLNVSFVGPVPVGPAAIDVTVLRAGSSVTQVQALLRPLGADPAGPVGAAALAAFGRDRASSLNRPATAAPPAMPPADQVPAWPQVPGLTPEFFGQVELRPTDAALPYSGAATSHVTGWMRLREHNAAPEFTEEHLVLLADAWPPAVLQLLTEPRPASSLTWSLALTDEIGPADQDPGGFWAYDQRTEQVRHGYAHTQAQLWRPDHTLVAISRQTVTVFG